MLLSITGNSTTLVGFDYLFFTLIFTLNLPLGISCVNVLEEMFKLPIFSAKWNFENCWCSAKGHWYPIISEQYVFSNNDWLSQFSINLDVPLLNFMINSGSQEFHCLLISLMYIIIRVSNATVSVANVENAHHSTRWRWWWYSLTIMMRRKIW